MENKNYLLSNFLDRLEVKSDGSNSSSQESPRAFLSADSLSVEIPLRRSNSLEKTSRRTDNKSTKPKQNADCSLEQSSNKTNFNKVFSSSVVTNDFQHQNNDKSHFILREIPPKELLKNMNFVSEQSQVAKLSDVNQKTKMAAVKEDIASRTHKKCQSSFDSVNRLEKCHLSPEIKKSSRKIPSVPEPKENDSCCLGYVESPSHFYIQVVCEEALFIDR